jgi:hypothetical protein
MRKVCSTEYYQAERKGEIGFRDMNLLNQPLLARQAWRPIHRPDSLCTRAIKVRYYPKENILDTVLDSDPLPPLAWNGIEFGLDLLKQGTINRINKVRKIQVFKDP